MTVNFNSFSQLLAASNLAQSVNDSINASSGVIAFVSYDLSQSVDYLAVINFDANVSYSKSSGLTLTANNGFSAAVIESAVSSLDNDPTAEMISDLHLILSPCHQTAYLHSQQEPRLVI
jgi:hypothetical protein